MGNGRLAAGGGQRADKACGGGLDSQSWEHQVVPALVCGGCGTKSDCGCGWGLEDGGFAMMMMMMTGGTGTGASFEVGSWFHQAGASIEIPVSRNLSTMARHPARDDAWVGPCASPQLIADQLQ